jgi:hypothetical protein
VKQKVTIEILAEQRDAEAIADAVREAAHREAPEQVDDRPHQEQDDETAPESNQKLPLVAAAKTLLQPVQGCVALDETRVAEHGKKRHDRGETSHRAQRHRDGDGLQPPAVPALRGREQAPDLQQRTHVTLCSRGRAAASVRNASAHQRG